jgi:uncharacterized protein
VNTSERTITMNEQHIVKIARELNLGQKQVAAAAELLSQDCTVPFIARYRKEATGTMDEVALTAVRDRLQQLADLDRRREAILKSLDERGLLNDELHAKLEAAQTMAVLEDIYLPFKPKRRTRASIAREKGLEPLANLLLEQDDSEPEAEAEKYINEEKGVGSVDEALQGARDIIAEQISEDEKARAALRRLFEEKGMLRSKVPIGKEEEAAKYRDYFEWEEPVKKAPSHRILAIRRGEAESLLMMRILPDEPEALAILKSLFVKGGNGAAREVEESVEDSYKRLLLPSMETETRQEAKKRADEEAVKVFAENLRQLLLAAPLGQKRVLALDPGFRTGCKVVCLDQQGKLLHNTTIYPHEPQKQVEPAAQIVRQLCGEFSIECIAVGNGTAGRETEKFVRDLDLPGAPAIIMVNENGASVYSASAAAREEFPDHDVTVRGSVSIGRRLMDPLAELVKIDPKSIGVGQYQHDVDQKLLKDRLDDVVMSCVNRVGVEVNTASKELLTYVSGLGPKLALSIVNYRNEQGPFGIRKDFLKVPGLGPRAFEQSAGFLRIRNGASPVDASAVHPESYGIVEQMARDHSCSVQELMEDNSLRERISLEEYVTETVGMPTLRDIAAELAKPGRDPRESFEVFSFAEGVTSMDDLREGMQLPGIVTNITNFGAFVDIGVHQDGLVHISQLADRFVKNPGDVVKLHQQVTVTVLTVDAARGRISLSMKKNPLPSTGALENK